MNKSYTNVTDSEATATNKRCTISVYPNVYHRLEEEGKFGESFSELIGRLLDLLKERKRLEQEKPQRKFATAGAPGAFTVHKQSKHEENVAACTSD